MNTQITKLFSVKEFCHAFSISRTTFYKQVNAERLRIIKLGRKTLIADDDAQDWLALLHDEANSDKSEAE